MSACIASAAAVPKNGESAWSLAIWECDGPSCAHSGVWIIALRCSASERVMRAREHQPGSASIATFCSCEAASYSARASAFLICDCTADSIWAWMFEPSATDSPKAALIRSAAAFSAVLMTSLRLSRSPSRRCETQARNSG